MQMTISEMREKMYSNIMNEVFNKSPLSKSEKEMIRSIVIDKAIPDNYNRFINTNPDPYDYSVNFNFRNAYTKLCSWTLVSNDWVDPLAKLLDGKKCVEIMAGKGLLSYALKEKGVDITPYDNFSWATYQVMYTDVINLDAKKALQNETEIDYVICSWPPCDEEDICEAVYQMTITNPKAKMIYIGESFGGCTACDDFFSIMDTICNGKEASAIFEISQYHQIFEGIHDSIYLMRPNLQHVKNWRKRRNQK